MVPPSTPAIRKVVETRERQYPYRSKAHPIKIDGRKKAVDDPGGVGREIVREILVCPACAGEPSADRTEGCGPPLWAVAA